MFLHKDIIIRRKSLKIISHRLLRAHDLRRGRSEAERTVLGAPEASADIRSGFPAVVAALFVAQRLLWNTSEKQELS